MNLHPIDLAIIAVYMVVTVMIGFIVKNRALKKLDSYFLADRSVRWWMLGLSGCSSYTDIGGTMVIIGMMFYVGLKSVWITHIFWGFFMMAFYMAFQAKYIRRSGVMTLAEWNQTRWHWWRFGAKAFVWSMIGTGCIAVAQKLFFASWPLYTAIGVSMIAAFLLTVLITVLTKPSDAEILVKFYSRVRPFGFWKPIRLEAERRGLVPPNDRMPRIDMLNAVLASAFQLCLGVIPFYLLLRNWNQALLWTAVCLILVVILYMTWYKNLPSPEDNCPLSEAQL